MRAALKYDRKADLDTIAPATGANGHAVSDECSFIEFFAGIGLVHEALAPSGWTCALANDNDPKKVDAYLRNYPDARVVLSDVRNLDLSALPRASLATASFPCT